MTRSNTRPSDLRRKALNEELSIPLVSNFFPIERYYDAADKVYESFCTALKQKSADDAYVYGKRYCLFCLDAIPTHNYYNSAKYRSTQVKHNKQVQAVIGQLETVVQWMDDEEVEKQRIARLKAERERLERERKQQERFDEFQRRVEQQKMRHGGEQAQTGGSTSSSSTAVEASALSKLDLLMRPNQSSSSSLLPPSSLPQKASQVHRIPQDPSGEEPIQGRPSSRYRLADDTDDDEEGGGGDAEYRNGSALPPPIPPPTIMINGSSAPPSYTQIMAAQQQHRKFLGPAPTAVAGHETMSSSSSSFVSGSRIFGNDDDVDNNQGAQVLQLQNDDLQSIKKLGHRIQMRKLQDYYRSQYIQFQQSGRIQVFSIPTYQGRIEESTNGCTVISALIAATHLNNSNSNSSNGGGNITDQQVTQVIDRTCGPILREIRRKLGLGGHALIIPSDVHDHLVDMKLLQQQYFEGAAGGNIMDAEHLGAFLKLLSVGDDGKSSHRKGAATLFFREHVISIVKIPNGNNQDSSSSAYYDLIDSLPSNGNGGGMSATRTRCKDLQSLVVLLNWYASRKFSDSNCSYIDRNAWDDATADFDPRVFQGFVWLVK